MSQELTVYEMVTPLAEPAEAKRAIQAYEALKQAIQQPSDVHIYQGRPFLKKSFWRRIAACFGLSLELVSEQRETDNEGKLAYSVYYRAVAPNGRTMVGDGYCSRSENGHGAWPEHTVRATAHTRAKNRAISDMVGGGEVSAEEIDYDHEPEKAKTATPRALPRPKIVEESADDNPMTNEELASASRALAGQLGIKKDDYAKQFAVQVNGGELVHPNAIIRAQRLKWYGYLCDLQDQRDKALAAEGVEDYEAIENDLGTLDPQDVKVS